MVNLETMVNIMMVCYGLGGILIAWVIRNHDKKISSMEATLRTLALVSTKNSASRLQPEEFTNVNEV